MTLDSSSDPVDAGSTIETTTGPIRLITAAAIFDGHDAAISIFRRIFQSKGCEVIHLGHDRGADEVAHAAIQEDAHAIAITSYQGGAVEMFTHTRQILDAAGMHHVHLFGGQRRPFFGGPMHIGLHILQMRGTEEFRLAENGCRCCKWGFRDTRRRPRR